jgi:acyl carrier protein
MDLKGDIRRFVSDNFLFGQGDSLKDDESFLDGGIIDSTGVLELVGFLEREYDIAIDDAELVPDNLDSVEKVSTFVSRKLQPRGPLHVQPVVAI